MQSSDGTKQGVTLRLVWFGGARRRKKATRGWRHPSREGTERKEEGRATRERQKQRGEEGRKKKTLDHTTKQQTEVEKEKRR